MIGARFVYLLLKFDLYPDYLQEEIVRLNKDIEDRRSHFKEGKFLGSAFIRCNLQLGAHVLAQCLSYHEVWFEWQTLFSIAEHVEF